MFTEKEKDYIGSQIIARIATTTTTTTTTSCHVSKIEKNDETKEVIKNQPDVVPVGFDFDGEYFYIGGKQFFKSLKYKNVTKNNKVALVIDDLESKHPWKPRGIRIYGTADLVNRFGGYMSFIDQSQNKAQLPYLRIKPAKKWSWGIEKPVFIDGKFVLERAFLKK
jgi:pyridoxamine 5'-phosphate oxidase family protein